MEKLLALGIAVVVFGVTFVGANVAVGPMDTSMPTGDPATLGMRSNASYLAPIPVNYSTVAMYQPPLISLAITRT